MSGETNRAEVYDLAGGLVPSEERMIWTFEKTHEKAAEIATYLRERGFSTRVYERVLRAEGVACWGYVVVTDKAAAL